MREGRLAAYHGMQSSSSLRERARTSARLRLRLCACVRVCVCVTCLRQRTNTETHQNAQDTGWDHVDVTPSDDLSSDSDDVINLSYDLSDK